MLPATVKVIFYRNGHCKLFWSPSFSACFGNSNWRHSACVGQCCIIIPLLSFHRRMDMLLHIWCYEWLLDGDCPVNYLISHGCSCERFVCHLDSIMLKDFRLLGALVCSHSSALWKCSNKNICSGESIAVVLARGFSSIDVRRTRVCTSRLLAKDQETVEVGTYSTVWIKKKILYFSLLWCFFDGRLKQIAQCARKYLGNYTPGLMRGICNQRQPAFKELAASFLLSTDTDI